MNLRKVIVNVFSVLSLVGLSSCLMTRSDVKEAETKKVMQDQVVHLQRTNADVSNKFQEYDAQLRELNGRTEAIENQLEQERKQREKLSKADESTLSEQGKTIELLKEEVLKIQSQISAMANQLAAVSALSENRSKPDSAEKTPATGPFEQGEELLAKKDWKKAILSYQKYRDTNPKGKKFADATYKIGVCFQELGMNTEAKSFFEEVISKFPNSESAKKAKIRMKKVK